MIKEVKQRKNNLIEYLFQSNANVLLKNSSSASPGSCNATTTSNNNNNEDANHYDNNGIGGSDEYGYVNLNSPAMEVMGTDKICSAVSRKLHLGYDLNESTNENALLEILPSVPMDAVDKQLFAFYTAQVITHSVHLMNSIDNFLQSVERNQPPKVFMSDYFFHLVRS